LLTTENVKQQHGNVIAFKTCQISLNHLWLCFTDTRKALRKLSNPHRVQVLKAKLKSGSKFKQQYTAEEQSLKLALGSHGYAALATLFS